MTQAIQNTLFQFLWALAKPMLTRRFTMLDYERDPLQFAEVWAKNCLVQLDFAIAIFGHAVMAALFGDSNFEFGNSARQMRGWNGLGITLNFGKAMSRFDHQVMMLNSRSGKELQKRIRDYRLALAVNCGGNHVLQNSMEDMDIAACQFANIAHAISPFVVAIDLPDINSPALAPLYGKTEDALRKDVVKANAIIDKYFRPTLKFGEMLMKLDAESPTVQPGLLFSLARELGDGFVHYSEDFRRTRLFPFLARFMRENMKWRIGRPV